jgi:hypothetical protein
MDEKDISIEVVATKILLVRGKAVKCNIDRFPEDFMFQFTVEENNNNLIFQNGISSWGGRRHLPYVFTEQGVAMLSVY